MSWLHLDVASASVSAATLLAVALAMRLLHRRSTWRWTSFLAAAALEIALVCGLFALWQLANRATHTAHSGGIAHGRDVWRAERWLHLPSETAWQHAVLGTPWLVRAMNYYYATAHLTGMVVFLVWLWLRHRPAYPRWRNVLVLLTGACLLIETIPVAPPRLIGGTGLVDTAMVYGQSVYAFVGSNLADQYAAMPSIHVGWAALIALAVWECARGWWRVVGVGHFVTTVLVVVLTANHYWLDGAAACALLALALAAERVMRRVVPALRWAGAPVVPVPAQQVSADADQIQQGALS